MDLQKSPRSQRQEASSSRRRFWKRIKRFRLSKLSKLSTPSVIGPFDYPQCFPAAKHEDTILETTATTKVAATNQQSLPKSEVPAGHHTHQSSPQPPTLLTRFLTHMISCQTDLPSIAEISCCSPDTTLSNDKCRSAFDASNEEIEVSPNHRVTVSNNLQRKSSPGPHIQLGTFESFVSELSWESSMVELPPPMAYYAVSSLKTMEEVYPRRCFFTGIKIAKNGLYYAGCVVQGRRTLVVFCHASTLPDGDSDIASRLSTKYSLEGLSNLTVWQSYNTVCHWSGLPIHTERDVHHRWKCGNVSLYLAEVVVEHLSLEELQALSGRYEAKAPAKVLNSLEFWETIDPTTIM